ncbi:uncharacterized protein LOC132701142 [Cylas formicarius]|uniref:uncharacterized protein LOC132701142 n=1 Tax=Cylas formicarius TaxID=197179 RepID=UPI00295865AB|nr:uncharacterized protein LOC132701142 [Cylas formicarius]
MRTLLVLIAVFAIVSAVPPRFRNRFARIETAPVPHTIYGPPTQPSPSYGPPVEVTTTEAPTTTEPASEPIDTSAQSGKLLANNFYYIYHPNGLLQKVSYSTKDDQRRMEFSAKLTYENVEPISGPVYTYDPQTYVLRQLQK